MSTYTRSDVSWLEPNMREYRKKVLTRALRIEGPFMVETREGTLECPDGYLALDSGGWLYPIAADEFARIYEEKAKDGGGVR